MAISSWNDHDGSSVPGFTGPETRREDGSGEMGGRGLVLTDEGRCPLPLTGSSDSVLPKTPIV